MVKWKNHVKGFLIKVKHPAIIPDIDTLIKSRNGMTKRIKASNNPDEKAKLKAIREEFDFLIDTL